MIPHFYYSHILNYIHNYSTITIHSYIPNYSHNDHHNNNHRIISALPTIHTDLQLLLFADYPYDIRRNCFSKSNNFCSIIYLYDSRFKYEKFTVSKILQKPTDQVQTSCLYRSTNFIIVFSFRCQTYT